MTQRESLQDLREIGIMDATRQDLHYIRESVISEKYRRKAMRQLLGRGGHMAFMSLGRRVAGPDSQSHMSRRERDTMSGRIPCHFRSC